VDGAPCPPGPAPISRPASGPRNRPASSWRNRPGGWASRSARRVRRRRSPRRVRRRRQVTSGAGADSNRPATMAPGPTACGQVHSHPPGVIDGHVAADDGIARPARSGRIRKRRRVGRAQPSRVMCQIAWNFSVSANMQLPRASSRSHRPPPRRLASHSRPGRRQSRPPPTLSPTLPPRGGRFAEVWLAVQGAERVAAADQLPLAVADDDPPGPVDVDDAGGGAVDIGQLARGPAQRAVVAGQHVLAISEPPSWS